MPPAPPLAVQRPEAQGVQLRLTATRFPGSISGGPAADLRGQKSHGRTEDAASARKGNSPAGADREDDVKLPRRRVLHLLAGAAALPGVSRFATAQTYPARPVRMIVGFPAGNAPDIVARLIGQGLSERLGQQFVIENRPGAGSNIATEAAVIAPADGYTLLMSVLTNVFNAALYPNLKFDFVRDLAPVASIADAPFVMVVNPSFPATNVPEFIAYAKANPGRINMASGGNGTSTHIFGELFKMMAGVDLVHVPYRSSYMPDLLSGQVHVVINPIPQAMEQIRTGKLRALGVTTAKRLETLPEIPTLGESIPGYEAVGWYGLSAPRNTPAEIVSQLNEATNAALADPRLRARLAGLGVEPLLKTPAEFENLITKGSTRWKHYITVLQQTLPEP
jgi:tripartite-type tricarboxylate transporter receptor subunit TctC